MPQGPAIIIEVHTEQSLACGKNSNTPHLSYIKIKMHCLQILLVRFSFSTRYSYLMGTTSWRLHNYAIATLIPLSIFCFNQTDTQAFISYEALHH